MNDFSSKKKMTEQLQVILKERGKKAIEMAKKSMFEEKIDSTKVREALNYYMTECMGNVTGPGLLYLVCQAVGGDPNITTPIAISLSLISGGIDIHDDIIDQSKSKNSKSTVFGKFGKNVAILTGEFLLVKGFTSLHEAVRKGITVEQIAHINDIINKALFELGNAIALELTFRERTDVSSEDYLIYVRKKAANIEAYTRISSILGNGTQKEIEALSVYGRLLGMMNILNNDLRDMLNFEEFAHRVQNEHLPLQVIYALEKSMNNNEINLILHKKKKTRSDFKKIIEFTNKAEGPVVVAEKINSIANEAIYQLKTIKTDKYYLESFIEALTPSIIEKN